VVAVYFCVSNLKKTFMKHIISFFIAGIILFTACKQKQPSPAEKTIDTPAASQLNFTDGQRADGRLFPDKLRDMPNEITAAHYPNPCYASYENNLYIWKHNITVSAKEDLQIVEYGSFVYTNKGWYLRVTLSPADFEKSYNCRGGLLKKGVVYTDNNSWRRGDKLTGGDAMWYFIAKDKQGKLIKGMAPIETENKLLSHKNRTLAITKTDISWTGYGELGGYSLTGTMNLKKAAIEMDSNKVTAASITFDISSISHENKQLVAHLKGEDFFESAKYPVASFITDEVIYTGAENAVAKGKLTIKGITKQMNIPVKLNSTDNALKVTGKIKVDRTAFGIKYNSANFFSNLGDQAIKNNFDLVFELTADY
jgi:polyisoprenoid-binding protein YceI